ncbi:MAG: hypothetical protein RI957_143 [Verrucomicrobiota bacterium]
MSLSSPVLAQAKPLKTYRNCVLQQTEWADGDSFQVCPPGAEPFTVRLYGADSMEWHIGDTTDSRRLRHQRSYFGITHVDPDPQRAAEIAKGYGAKAAAEVTKMLEKPFTVHTAEADARGDANFKRVYAFVVTADGKDLAEELVRLGLARAFGVTRETYHRPSRPAREYAAGLTDLELQAAINKRGIWSITNWEQLPAERKLQREEEAKDLIGIDNAKAPQGKRVDPNSATRSELTGIPGIGEKSADEIIKHRPYRRAEDLLKVPGIGSKTLEKMKDYLEFAN